MSRAFCSFVWTVGLAVGVAGTCAGCAHMIENRAITAFAKSLEKNDLGKLKEVTSDEFSERALRSESSLEDLKNLNLPNGKSTVVDVEEISKNKKRVTVHVGENKKEIYYEIARDDSGNWVVDNIFMKQKRKGIEAYKSVTEQMDLLLTVREFMDAWSSGDREQVLSVTTPKFRAALDELPPRFLAQLTRQVTRGKPKSGKLHPRASMDEKIAVVTLPRTTGSTVLTMELRKGNWRVANIGIESKDEEEKLPSAMNLATAVNRCIAFLSAYQTDDKDKLSELCLPEFFSGSLSFADLKQVTLPEPQLSDHELQVRLRGNRADFILRNENEFVQIDMQRQPETSPDSVPSFVVSDVTIYEIATKQEKRLSALFTAQGMLEVFIDALSNRQIDKAKHCSTHDFSTRVWSKLNETTISSMPLDIFDATDVEYVTASFLGALTKIEVRQGGRPLTYLLRDEGGRFMVDDIQWQFTGVPDSVKSTLEVLIPIQDFASGVAIGRDPEQQEKALDLIRGNCSNDFNRMVWAQSSFVPNSGMSADTFLQAPLKSIAISESEVVVHFGDSRYGAKVTMTLEHNRFIVDDVQLIAGPQESERISVRQSLRSQLARGEARAPQAIQQVSHVGEPDNRVQQATYEVISDAVEEPENPGEEPRELDAETIDPFGEEPVPGP